MVKYDAPRFSLNFSSVSVKDFLSVLRLSRVITLRYSIGFQCNLVHEETILSPTSCSQKIYCFCTILAFCRLHEEYWAGNLESLGSDTLSKTETSRPCIISKRGLVVHQFNILLS